MLLRIYFLSFLLFHYIFCYDYMQENLSSNYLNKRHRNGQRRRRIHSQKRRRSSPHEEEPLAQLDLASFIQNPEDTENSHQLQDSKSNSDLNEYENLESIESMLKPNIYSLQNYNNEELYNGVDDVPSNDLNKNEQSYRNSERKEGFSNDSPEISFSHTGDKKCLFKTMKFPFFFRKSNESAKMKNSRNKRLFGFHKNKKHSTTSTKATESSTIHLISKDVTKNHQNYFKLKRSYFEKVCPLCKRKYIIADENLNNEENEPIHNIRQYYPRINSKTDRNNDNFNEYKFIENTNKDE